MRAAVFSGSNGELRSHAIASITVHSPRHDYYEYSSDSIWSAVGAAVKQAVSNSNISIHHVVSIGFDATCSL